MNNTLLSKHLYHNGGTIFQGGTLYTAVVSRNVRTVFTLAFSVLTALIALLGALYIRRRNQRILLRHESRTIPLHHLSSWMTVTELLRYYYKTRKLPAGGYAWLMLAVGAFELTAHIFTNQYINTSKRQSFCLLDQGIYDVGIEETLTPQSQLAPANIAISAQIYNAINGGDIGIYSPAVANETYSVLRTSEDYLGSWVCTDVNDPQTYPQGMNYTLIEADLIQKGNLFETAAEYNLVYARNESTVDIFMWSSSVDSNTREPWDVKAAFSTSVIQGETITMDSYFCTLGSPSARTTLSHMPSDETLEEWKQKAYGLITAVYIPGGPDSLSLPPLWIAVALNAANMVAATGNNLRSAEFLGQTYDCLLQYTAVNGEVIIAIIILFLIFLFFVLGELWLVCVTAWKRKMPLVEDCPCDLASWQTAMLNNVFLDDAEVGGTGARKIEPKQMGNYTFGWGRGTDGHDRTMFKKVGSDDVSFSVFDGRSEATP